MRVPRRRRRARAPTPRRSRGRAGTSAPSGSRRRPRRRPMRPSAGRPRRGSETASTQISAPWRCATSVSAATSLTTPVEVSEWVVKTARTPVARARERPLELLGLDPRPPLAVVVVDVAAVGLAQLGPALRRTSRTRRPAPCRRERRGWRPPTPSPPVPGGGEHEHVVLGLEHHLEALQHALVDLDEGRRAVIEDRLRHHLRHGRRQRGRPRRHQIVLVEDVHGRNSAPAKPGRRG